MRSLVIGMGARRAACVRESASRQIARLLLSTRWWQRAQVVLCYVALPSEVATARLIEVAIAEGRTVGVPRVRGGDIEFCAPAAGASGYVRSRLGTLEPAGDPRPIEPPPGQEVLVVVPGLMFDLKGYRLGRGGGYYDRCLARLRSLGDRVRAVGLCFDEHFVAELPSDPWDERVDAVVTEARGVVECGSEGRSAP